MLYRNKYRVESTRLKNWDYSSPGWYFVTICTHDRLHFLSDIIDNQVVLKPAGIIANEEWLKTGVIRPHVEIDEYVIMPNHIHGIVRIKPNRNSGVVSAIIDRTINGVDSVIPVETPCHGVSTIDTTDHENPTAFTQTTNEPQNDPHKIGNPVFLAQ